MFLLINASVKDSISLTLFKGNFVEQKNYSAPNRDLLLSIESFLEVNNLRVQDVEGIAVVVGAGAFTSTRIATTLANTWVYSKNIPVIAITVEESSDCTGLEQKLTQAEPGIFISATYSGEPNIGKPLPK